MVTAIDGTSSNGQVVNGSSTLTPKELKMISDMFKHVSTFTIVALWEMSKTAMDSIDATQSAQEKLMNLDEQIEQSAEGWSELYTNQLGVDVKQITSDADPNNGMSDSDRSAAIGRDTSFFNEHNTDMQTMSSFFSGMNNLVNNGTSAVGQNISLNTTNVQQGVQKFFDMIAQMVATVY